MDNKPILHELGLILKNQDKILFFMRVLAERTSGPDVAIPDLILDDHDVMMKLKISKKTLSRRREDGSLPYEKIKRKYYYKESDVLRLLNTPFAQDAKRKPGPRQV